MIPDNATAARSGRLSGTISRTQLHGIVALLVGASQAAVALAFAGDLGLLTFVVASGGWLLVAIGTNLLREGDAFRSDWNEDGELGWIAATLLVVIAVVVVVAAGFVLVSG